MSIKLKGPVLIALGCVVLIGLLIVSSRLTNELLFVLGGVAALALWKWNTDPHLINFWEARQIAEKTATKMQERHELPDGEIDVMEQTRRRWRLIIDEDRTEKGSRSIQSFEPYKWDVGIIVEGIKQWAYLVEIDVYGSLIGFVPIAAPSLFSLLDQPDIHEFRGREKPGRRITGEEYDEE